MKTQFILTIITGCGLALLAGCGKSAVDEALTADANGYICLKCQAKFYTARDVFATRCPQCQQVRPEIVLAYQCPDDKQVTLAGRGQGSATCSKCGKTVTTTALPHEADFKAWGATKRTAAEVGG